MSRSYALALLVAAGLLAACSSDATGPRPNFSCENQGSNTSTGCQIH